MINCKTNNRDDGALFKTIHPTGNLHNLHEISKTHTIQLTRHNIF